MTALEYVDGSLDPKLVLEGDTYWAAVGGQDPVELLVRLGDRVKLIHIKDGPATTDTKAQQPAGQGTISVLDVIAVAKSLEVSVVEFDYYSSDIFEGITQSLAYLTVAASAEAADRDDHVPDHPGRNPGTRTPHSIPARRRSTVGHGAVLPHCPDPGLRVHPQGGRRRLLRQDDRVIGAGPKAGEEFAVEVPTHVSAMAQFEGGKSSHSVFSFESPHLRMDFVEITGSEATLSLEHEHDHRLRRVISSTYTRPT
jgi:hypothetical protein